MPNILWKLAIFFIQPVFLIGLVYIFFNKSRRIKYTRKNYRVNFNRTNYELKDFLLQGIIPGMIISILIFALGIPITMEWYIIYQVITILLLLISGFRLIHPIFTFLLASIVLYDFKIIGIDDELDWLKESLNIPIGGFIDSSALIRNTLALAALILLLTLVFMKKPDPNKVYPILKKSKRGKTIAKYQYKKLWLLPLVVLAPGEMIAPFANWWPLFNIGQQEYSFLLLPFLVGVHYTVSMQFFEEAVNYLKKDLFGLTIFSLLATAIAYFFPAFSSWIALIVFISGIYTLYRHRNREKMGAYKYGPSDEGLRIIAVRKDSPAERMNLSMGDIIMEINNYPMTSRNEFDEVITFNRSYIKMRVKREDGEIIIAETPLYEDDYNNLGVLLLDN